VLVDRLPAGVLDRLDAALEEQRLERRRVRVGGEQAGACVLEQAVARLGGVLAVRADDAARAALDPAGAVDAADRVAALLPMPNSGSASTTATTCCCRATRRRSAMSGKSARSTRSS